MKSISIIFCVHPTVLHAVEGTPWLGLVLGQEVQFIVVVVERGHCDGAVVLIKQGRIK